MLNRIHQLIAELLTRLGSNFVSFIYTNSDGETSRYVVNINKSFVEAYKRDLATVTAWLAEATDTVHREVLGEMQGSLETSLAVGIGNNPDYTLQNYYTQLAGCVSIHDNRLYVRGFVVSRKVLVKGNYKTVNSRPRTLIKNDYRRKLETGKIRTFILDPLNLTEARLNGRLLTLR